jgi:uncharacterized protein (DUF433 family)
VVLANLADGLSAEEILKSYPTLTAAGIQAALAYAADLAQERVLPLPAQQPQSGYNGPMSTLDRITVSPDVCGGRPCIRGLRIRVKDVLDLLAAGATREEILADYPYLEPEDITAVLEFAARQNDHPILRTA